MDSIEQLITSYLGLNKNVNPHKPLSCGDLYLNITGTETITPKPLGKLSEKRLKFRKR